MPWTTDVSDSLTLTGAYQTVKKSASDLIITRNPGETLQLLLEFNPQASPTEDGDIIVCRSHDGTTFESDGSADRVWLQRANRENDDPNIVEYVVRDSYAVKIRARVRDDNDQGGGTDPGSTLRVHYAKDGVSL